MTQSKFKIMNTYQTQNWNISQETFASQRSVLPEASCSHSWQWHYGMEEIGMKACDVCMFMPLWIMWFSFSNSLQYTHGNTHTHIHTLGCALSSWYLAWNHKCDMMKDCSENAQRGKWLLVFEHRQNISAMKTSVSLKPSLIDIRSQHSHSFHSWGLT